jgi:hypothetical protein
MLRDKLDGVIQIARFKRQDSPHLFLGLGVRTVGHSDFAVLPGKVLAEPGG